MSTGSPAWSAIGQYYQISYSAVPSVSAARPAEGFDGKAEFNFAVGTVRGYRWWKLQAPDLPAPWDQWNPPLLTGRRDKPWGPGVNAAACNYYPAAHQPPVECDPVTGPCGCGFWGYWDMQDYNMAPGTQLPVAGVIEGFGRTLVGELGFRCEKARIAALCLPAALRHEPAYPGRPAAHGVTLHGVTLTAGGLRAYRALTGRGHGTAEAPASRDRQQQYDAWMGVIQDRLMTMYPGAQVFTSTRAMLAMFPPAGAPGPGELEAG